VKRLRFGGTHRLRERQAAPLPRVCAAGSDLHEFMLPVAVSARVIRP
jgi:hypothetical protein